MLKFNDGMSFDTSGPLRITRRSDGLYVVGQGMLIPVSDREEAKEIIEEMRDKNSDSGS
jgi:hypothetical protein